MTMYVCCRISFRYFFIPYCASLSLCPVIRKPTPSSFRCPQPSFFSIFGMFGMSVLSEQHVWKSPLHGWNVGSGLSSSPNLQNYQHLNSKFVHTQERKKNKANYDFYVTKKTFIMDSNDHQTATATCWFC